MPSRRPCSDPYNRDTGIEVYFHRADKIREFIACADNAQHAKKIARNDARETERPLRGYHWHRVVTQCLPIFDPEYCFESPSKIGVSTRAAFPPDGSGE